MVKMARKQQGIQSLFINLKILQSRSSCTHKDVNGAIKTALSERVMEVSCFFSVTVPEVSLKTLWVETVRSIQQNLQSSLGEMLINATMPFLTVKDCSASIKGT